MVRIIPIAASEGLMAVAGKLLPSGAPLVLYGLYLEEGGETVEWNLAFDARLKTRNPVWRLRSGEWVDALATRNGLARIRRVAMPANTMLVYRKA